MEAPHPPHSLSGAGILSLPTPQAAAKTVSIIIPIYNESAHINEVVNRVLAAPLPTGLKREVIIVDDGSTDGTTSILETLNDERIVRIHHSILNFGKGTAIRIGLRFAAGDFILIQDGDLELDPNEYGKILNPLLDGKAEVVYGSRFLERSKRPAGMRWQNYLANRLLTFVANMLYGARITDEATAYKAFRREIVQQIELRCKRFEFCPEVTAKFCRLGKNIHEVPISFDPRGLEEGKKVRWTDGLWAIWTLLRYRLQPRAWFVLTPTSPQAQPARLPHAKGQVSFSTGPGKL